MDLKLASTLHLALSFMARFFTDFSCYRRYGLILDYDPRFTMDFRGREGPLCFQLLALYFLTSSR